MALISCPHCQKQNSSQSVTCSQCGKSMQLSASELEALQKKQRRAFRDKMYRWKMLSFVGMALALVGAVPMIWDYARSVDYGFNASVLNHWGSGWVIAGFALYLFTRVMMVLTKKNYKK